MTTLNDTPGGSRLHIGIFGRTNSGKSSFINAFTGQKVSIVADQAGTTTDPVYKPMEIHPLGACVIIDTAGFADESALGESRLQKTRLAAEKSDIAIILLEAEDWEEGLSFRQRFPEEYAWHQIFAEKNTPVLFLVNKADLYANADAVAEKITRETGREAFSVSALTGEGINRVKETLSWQKEMKEQMEKERLERDTSKI